MFKSYIFVHIEENERNNVFVVPSVVRYLTWLKKPAVVQDSEIKTLKEWLDNGKYETLQVHSFTPGDEVTINHGALRGQSGTVQEIGKREVKLVLKSLGFVVTTKLKDIT